MSDIITQTIPRQPFFVMALDRYYKIDYRKYGISHFYLYRTSENCPKENIHILPDGTVGLRFSLNEDNPSVMVGGTVASPDTVSIDYSNIYFGVRFLPGFFPPFLDADLYRATFSNQFSAENLIGNSAFEQIVFPNQEITHYFDKNPMVSLLYACSCSFLRYYMPDFIRNENTHSKPALLVQSIDEIKRRRGTITVKELSELTFYSSRHIGKVFSEYLGISPKLFAKIVRFQNVLSECLINPERPLVETASILGYTDQSHMTKDFRMLAGTTPRKFIIQTRGMDYWKKIRFLGVNVSKV